MISICLATKGRPSIFKRMCQSALDNATDPSQIEFVSYHENIDKTLSEYEYVGNHQIIIGDPIPGCDKYNKCQRIANSDIYMMIADDFVFESKNWDKNVLDAFDEYPDKIVLVWPDDYCYRSRFGQSLFIHKNWVDAVGYFATPYFATQYLDSWWNDVAKIINRRKFLRHTVVKHYCIADDETHKEYMALSRKENSRKVFGSEEMRNKRIADAAKLQAFIDSFDGSN